ncbi:MAG: hypothetical protein JWO86_1553 [Myxococcaceae bacterium]|nr:hypothetical protein [Myxococcaceae bacterium]
MAKPPGATSRDQALDELYGASPAEFTGKRDALAKALKAEGDVAGANEIKAQRKPTQIAYVLNQLARKHADDLADLVDVGRELARAQRKALRGEAGHDLRDAIARQRSVVSGLTAKTASLMGELGVSPTGHLDEIASALQAALVDPAVGAKLEEGRLDKVPAPAAGFPGATPQEVEVEPGRVKADASADASAKAKAHADAHAKAKEHAKAKAKAHAHDAKADAKGRAEEKRRAAEEAKERREAERKEAERAKRETAASSAGKEAAEQARIADAAEREADGYAAEAKKLDEEARSLAADAKRLAADATLVAREAEVARGSADRAATAAARAAKVAKTARSDAERAVKHARTVAARI